MSSIKPGFICYRPQRYHVGHQHSIKYGISANKLNYACSGTIKRQERLNVITQRGQVRGMSHCLCVQKPDNDRFLKLVSRIQNVKKLGVTIRFNTDKVDEAKKMKKLITKILRYLKNVESLEVCLYREGKKNGCFLGLVNVLKKLKHLKLKVCCYKEVTIKALECFLEKARRCRNLSNLETQAVQFVLEPGIPDEAQINNSIYSLADFMKFLKEMPECGIKDIKLVFPLRQRPENMAIESLGEALTDLPYLTELALGSGPDWNFAPLLKCVRDNPYLKDLNLSLASEQTHKILGNLAPLLASVKSLKKLTIWVRNLRDVSHVCHFFQQLRQLTQITHLVLNFNKVPYLQNATLAILAQSLSTMSNLESLDLNFNKPPQNSLLTGCGIHSVFEAIGKLRNLRELHLSFCDYKDNVCNEVFEKLCDSLKDLTKLKYLRLNLASNNIDGRGMCNLAKSFLSLTKLETVVLDFRGHKSICSLAFVKVMCSLAHLKSLSSLTLGVRVWEISDPTHINFVRAINLLKCLNYFEFYLFRNKENTETENVIVNAVNQLQEKLEVKFEGPFF